MTKQIAILSTLIPSARPAPATAAMRPAKLVTIFRSWIARGAERRALRELADCNDQHMLDDIGVTREQAQHTATKWFWQP